jgi:isoleucyl-tRNA synthetase
MAYKALPADPVDAFEGDLLAQWRLERLPLEAMAATRYGPPFVFYEGPPTANGRPGLHHVVSRTIKDLICRFHSMQGKSVTRIAGWDTHGLPVEIEVEKQLQISGKKQIEEFGIAKFNQLCRESVFRYKADWESLSERIGYWLDYEHAYVTFTPQYIETVWWLLKRLSDRGLLFRGHKVLPYCPRCGTALSSHEVAQGYDQVTAASVYLAVPTTDDPKRRLVVWTTTPWTLVSNIAIAVHPDLEYGEYQLDGVRYVAAVARAGDVKVGGRPLSEGKLVKTYRGADLAGWTYRRPLEVVPLPPEREGRSQVVVPAEFVSDDEGTGLVHMAPAFGADDYATGQQHGLAFVNPVTPEGTFAGTKWKALEGKLVTDKATNHLILERLKELGVWLETRSHTHTYPFCWRCDSPLIYYARSSWFVRTTAVKGKMLEFNRQVGWHPPEMGSGRFGEWLENNVDWVLSRDRYWGTPLNIWECDRVPDHREVIGSYAELAERHGKPLPPDFDPHKPHIDGYTWKCAQCAAATMRRVPEVIDAWFDSGAMPYAQWHYPFEHQQEFQAHFPADYICEGVDQTRGWFYSLLAIGTAAFEQPAFKNVIVNELVLDAEGRKMAKSRGNVVNPWEVVQAHGADAARLFLVASSQVWLPKRFDARQIPKVVGGFLNTLRNTYGFFALYAEEWAPAADDPPAPERPAVDRWLLGRLDATVAAVRASWSDYEPTAGARAIMSFVVDDLSNWYVRVSRPRFWAPDRSADRAALATLREALVTTARLLAPVAPFLPDWIHRALEGTSVHLAPFPVDQGRRDPELAAAMDGVRRLASLARAARESKGLAVRQPLARMSVAVPPSVKGMVFAELLEVLREEVNVKTIVVVESDADLVRLKGKADFRALGKRYGKDTPLAAAAAAALDAGALRRLEAGETVEATHEGRTFSLAPGDVTVSREVASDWLVASDGPYVAALDPALTDDLIQEGLARELVNRIQRLRKDAGYTYTTRIEWSLVAPDDVVQAASAYQAFIEGETLARRTLLGEPLPEPDVTQDLDILGRPVTIAVRRADGKRRPTR